MNIEIHDEEDNYITEINSDCCPSIGETVWFLPTGTRKAAIVADVCHWISTEQGNNYHNCCVYVEEIEKPPESEETGGLGD